VSESDEIIASLRDMVLHGPLRRAKEAGTPVELSETFDFLSFALRRCRVSRSQMSQDLWVLYELADRKGGYFVEFGAGDGVVLSNTFLLETGYAWNGVLAEPNPVFHDALRRNRRAVISTDCIAGQSGETVTFNLTEDPHFSTIDRYTAEDGHAVLRASGTRIPVPTRSLTDLLRQANAPRRIDYLSIDTEGSEYEVLSAFDFKEYDVELLTVEHNHTPRQQQLHVLLERNGFARKFPELSDFDAWYVNRRPPP
jgi:FkbM family methyltransferase